MIKWTKLEAGSYESEDKRFHIVNAWDRIHGNHWCLHDRNNTDYYKGSYCKDTLSQCKLIAENLE